MTLIAMRAPRCRIKEFAIFPLPSSAAATTAASKTSACPLISAERTVLHSALAGEAALCAALPELGGLPSVPHAGEGVRPRTPTGG